jgi:RecJ-like exonuclease
MNFISLSLPDPTPAHPVHASDDTADCPRCRATGEIRIDDVWQLCPTCYGTGEIKSCISDSEELQPVFCKSWRAL